VLEFLLLDMKKRSFRAKDLFDEIGKGSEDKGKLTKKELFKVIASPPLVFKKLVIFASPTRSLTC
jgi:hypothetical protein